jgi:hypothetical protein
MEMTPTPFELLLGSFWAEGYGMACALLYLQTLYQQFEFNARQKCSVNKLICDNMGLLIRIEEASEWTYTMPNVTLRAEWDIELMIDSNFFMHVKSHQDDKTPMSSLSLESRLNVEANRLAT